MPFSAGDKLGPYEILASIGAGGMGEVYKARDTRLDRVVAIKVSKTEFSERFEREARAVAALNHPNICQLYDVGPNYLVMEYVEGAPLKGPLPLDQTLKYAVQICDALDAAHKKNITHRDLKPANILATKAGIKLLDFGLAKLGSAGIGQTTKPPGDATLTMALTGKGEILGTLLYMSPEQINGEEAGPRSDIFSFGLVLYEMVTGKKAFEGKSQASVIAAILEREPPPMSSLQPMTPPALDRVVKKCLAKEPEKRWQAASDISDALKWIAEDSASYGGPSAGPVTPARVGRRWVITAAMASVLGATIAALVVWSLMRAPKPQTRPVARLRVTLPATDRLAPESNGTEPMALSPDGSLLVYVGRRGRVTQLFVRNLDSFDAKPIPGTEGAESAFFSPDGQSIGFVAGRQLKKVALSGGAPLSLSDVLTNRGASWGPDGTIIFTPTTNVGLSRISAAGGAPKPVTTPDRKKGEYGHLWPQILPGGKAVLFTIWTGVGGIDRARIAVLSLATGKQTILAEGGSYARYVSSGHIVYARAGGLLAVPFDLQRLEATGSPVSILEGVEMDPNFGAAYFSTSAEGSLAYLPGGIMGGNSTLVWVDRRGAVQPLSAPPRGMIRLGSHPMASGWRWGLMAPAPEFGCTIWRAAH